MKISDYILLYVTNRIVVGRCFGFNQNRTNVYKEIVEFICDYFSTICSDTIHLVMMLIGVYTLWFITVLLFCRIFADLTCGRIIYHGNVFTILFEPFGSICLYISCERLLFIASVLFDFPYNLFLIFIDYFKNVES